MEREREAGEEERRREVEGSWSGGAFFCGVFQVVVSESGIWLQSGPREIVREN